VDHVSARSPASSSSRTSSLATGRLGKGLIDWADGLVAIADGADPDSGTCWEVGYVFRSGKPIVLVRTDLRELAGDGDGYNPMVAESATLRLDMPAASTTEVVTALLEALSMLERDPAPGQR
jgi:nucleoside 2-deoxyribosyltransferase